MALVLDQGSVQSTVRGASGSTSSRRDILDRQMLKPAPKMLPSGPRGIGSNGLSGHIHLVKLSVGTESVETLADWQHTVIARNKAAGLGPITTHTTRMWPWREAEILAGGSIFWVIRGVVQCRQRITGLEERIGQDGIRRCAIVLDPHLMRTQAQPRRAFQGWRYLQPADAPGDLGPLQKGEDALPTTLLTELNALGVL